MGGELGLLPDAPLSKLGSWALPADWSRALGSMDAARDASWVEAECAWDSTALLAEDKVAPAVTILNS